MDYTELVAAVTDYLQEGDTTFTGYIDTFIQQAEERIVRSVYIPAFRKLLSSATANGVSTLTVPSDYVSTLEFAVISGGNHSYLLPKDASFLREAYPGAATTGLPKYYANTDEATILMAPTPDAIYTVELYYYHSPESIVTATNTWLGDNASTALLYGTLVEGYRFLKGDADLLAEYQKRFDEALGMLQRAVSQRTKTDSYRAGEAMV